MVEQLKSVDVWCSPEPSNFLFAYSAPSPRQPCILLFAYTATNVHQDCTEVFTVSAAGPLLIPDNGVHAFYLSSVIL